VQALYNHKGEGYEMKIKMKNENYTHVSHFSLEILAAADDNDDDDDDRSVSNCLNFLLSNH